MYIYNIYIYIYTNIHIYSWTLMSLESTGIALDLISLQVCHNEMLVLKYLAC
jgi:hypothetical protein